MRHRWSSQTLPLISIITPCLNRVAFVAEAIESVLAQNYPNFEHIIVDGGSTDGTLEVLQNYPHLKVISEPDEGLYDAINKGLRICTGEIVGFLNTDDLYAPNIFESIAEVLRENPEIDAVSGGATIFEASGGGEKTELATYGPIARQEIWHRLTEGASIFNAWFFRKTVFTKIGSFNTKYLYVSDRDFLIRCAFHRLCHLAINTRFCTITGNMLVNYTDNTGQ
jgi:glycosyltransferase involved in cell wall biosynthesis